MQHFFSVVFIILLMSVLVFFSEKPTTNTAVTADSKVSEVLKKLGDKSIQHYANTGLKDVSAEVGENLIRYGFAKANKGNKQSKHFVCTSCHNLEREDPDLKVSDPQARLEYTSQKGLPFLQGTTLYGAVNRTSFYNGDYDKKYGDLVKPARNDIREAIQLCAVECAQGRRLKNWEVESVLAFLWTLELDLQDLGLSDKELKNIKKAVQKKASKAEKNTAIQTIKSSYLDGSPATFVTPPDNRKTGYAKKGDPMNGELIYKNSCLHCHGESRYSYFALDNSSFTFSHLEKHFPKYSRYSIYQVSRYGTPPMNGKRAYMPQYTKEKMSDQQVEDLRAYISSN